MFWPACAPAVPTSLLRASHAENAAIWSVDSPVLLTASRPNSPGRRFRYVQASKKRELVDAAHDLVRCERPSYKEAYGRRSTTATIAGSGWPKSMFTSMIRVSDHLYLADIEW